MLILNMIFFMISPCGRCSVWFGGEKFQDQLGEGLTLLRITTRLFVIF